ncbi:uncharacterized protein LOC130413469 [Triplophysa dalaica]|uniref:uncharacterized protein LOC130413469 n=1 Tax=Triplophysa dalaica TaxID=1582913 RepID=UPI0024DF783E|nr:uncharacterized protein LOC130413469 [Triplophysa dalaica]
MSNTVLLLLLICSAISVDPAVGFHGGSMTFSPENRYPDGTVEMHFYYRESGRGPCDPKYSWRCESEDCGHLISAEPQLTYQDRLDQSSWCQTERHMITNVTSNDVFILGGGSCCWANNVNDIRELTLHTHVDARQRSDTRTPNRSPVSAAIPNMRVPQNCFETLQLLAYDPDGDQVRCKCPSCNQHPNIYVDEGLCALKRNGLLGVGLHVFQLILEDYSVSNITLTNGKGISTLKSAFNRTTSSDATPLSQVPLQFAVEILPPVESCVPGVTSPIFLTPTPLHGDVQHAAVGKIHVINLRAQSSGRRINDFQVSAPWNMSKSLQNESDGVTVATLTWTPQVKDLHRHVPVCFSAETLYSQSKMRCIVVIVAKSEVLSGEAEILCEDNSISIAVQKNSMKGIDQNWLKLRDPTCSLTSNETHILGTMSLNTCGTTIEESGDFLVFKNEINSFENPTEVITRRSQVKISFSCQYPRVSSVSNHYKNLKSDYIFTESSFGTFGYSFDIFTDQNFTRQVDSSLHAMEVNVMDVLYVGIEAHSALPDVRLFVESCRATPDDNPYSVLFYDIIKNGCVLDDTVNVFSGDVREFKFGIKAFKFTGDYSEVYISCSVILCAEASVNSRCAQGCLEETALRRKRDVTQETATHYITQGPFRVLRHNQHAEAASGNEDSLHISVSTGVFAGLFILCLMTLVGLLVYYAKKARAQDSMYLLSSF